MKKTFFAAAILAVSFCMSSCGLGGGSGLVHNGGAATTASTAATGLGTLASALTGTNGASTSLLGNVLTSLLGNKTSESSIAGTWVYNAPKVVFESESVLAQLGSTVASSKIESSLSNQLKKIGFSAGKSAITFDGKGNYSMALGSKSYTGTYILDPSTNTMTLTGMLGLASMNCTVSVAGNEMCMLFGADKVLSMASAVSKVNSTLNSLLGNYTGMKLGWSMVRQ